jgi:hypothetical protein
MKARAAPLAPPRLQRPTYWRFASCAPTMRPRCAGSSGSNRLVQPCP